MKKSVKKQDNREYTIKIIPHKGEEVRSIRLPIRTIKYSAAAVCAGVILFAGAFGYSAYSASVAEREQAELGELRQVNTLQQTQILQLSQKANSLQDDLNELGDLENEIRQIAAIDGSSASRSGFARNGEHNGQGGPGITPDVNIINSTLDSLSQVAKTRKQNLQALKESITIKQARIAVTPSIWPTSGEVSSRYGLRWSGSDFHPGVDIADNEGTPILVTADGVVLESGWNSGGYGYLIDVDHGNGIITRYAHNSKLAVSAGQTVKKGQLIAYMGNTGFSTGPHLHYEVIVNGKSVNPDRFL